MDDRGDDSEVRPGDVLAGKYRVERVIGAGGMGSVVAATHLVLGEPVAIKLLLPDVAEKPGVVERFVREGRAALRIKSEHVVRIMDVDMLPNGMPMMVMELLDGCDLRQYVARHGQLEVAETCDILLQACSALAEAHALGIVHRDLKPANIFLATRPGGQMSVKLLDFGISKVGAVEGEITNSQAILGSPYYMSPEQMRSAKTVDARTDVWALGVMLFEMLTGERPFPGDTLTEVMLAVVTTEPPEAGPLRPDAPAELIAAVNRCLRKDREERFASVAELAQALAPFGTAGARELAERAGAFLRVPPPRRSLTSLGAISAGSGAPVSSGPGSSGPGTSSPGSSSPDARAALRPSVTVPGAAITSPGSELGARKRRWPLFAGAALALAVAAGLAVTRSGTGGSAAGAPLASSAAIATATSTTTSAATQGSTATSTSATTPPSTWTSSATSTFSASPISTAAPASSAVTTVAGSRAAKSPLVSVPTKSSSPPAKARSHAEDTVGF